MPQPKSSKPASPSPEATAATMQKAAGAGRTASPSKRATSASKPPRVKGQGVTPEAVEDPASAAAQAARDEALKANLSQLRELLAGGVVLTAQRVQEAMDDAVRRGKMTRRDAEEVARGLLDTGRKQSVDMIAEIEALFDKGRNDLGAASSRVRDGTDRMLREVDRVRRHAGVGTAFPITGYDELTAAQITSRLADLDASDLRRVRDHERKTANRKSVLAAIDKRTA